MKKLRINIPELTFDANQIRKLNEMVYRPVLKLPILKISKHGNNG